MAEETPNTPAELPEGVTIAGEEQGITVTAEEARAAEEKPKLAGKFADATELEKAYLELQKKLGEGQSEEEPEETPGEEPEEKAEEKAEEKPEPSPYGEAVDKALADAGVSLDEAKAAFEADGDLTDEQFSAFEKAGFPRSMVEAYLTGVRAASESNSQITETQISQIKALAGGDEGFGQVQQHIAQSYSPEQLTEYNEAVSSGDFSKAQAAVRSAVESYKAEIGVEGALLGGKAPEAQAGYKSEAEMINDMKDARYKKDPAFRAEVERKIMSSPNLMRTR